MSEKKVPKIRIVTFNQEPKVQKGDKPIEYGNCPKSGPPPCKCDSKPLPCLCDKEPPIPTPCSTDPPPCPSHGHCPTFKP
jgi:hypothetical protein